MAALLHPNINPQSAALGDLTSHSPGYTWPWDHITAMVLQSYFPSKSLKINVQEIAPADL